MPGWPVATLHEGLGSGRQGRCLAIADDHAAPAVLGGEDCLTLALAGALEHTLAAAAINMIRLDAYWTGHPLDRTRTSHLARLDFTLAT